jgi:hypothetical protein
LDRPLKVVIDLANRDKHSGPDRGGGLSGLSPDLKHFSRGLTATGPGHKVVTATISFFGDTPPVEFGEGAGVVTNADVVDASGGVIGDAITFIETSLETWELVLADYGVVEQQESDQSD